MNAGLRDRLQRLRRLEALGGGPITPQVRGLEFEIWIRDALDAEQLAPRTRYRPKGEEIDGSFVGLLAFEWLRALEVKPIISC